MKYALKKVLMMLITMVIVSFFAFLAFQIIPGDPTTKILGDDATPEAVAELRAELGLDRPFIVRYSEWIINAVQGDFGSSYVYSQPVSELLGGKLAVTGLLTAIAFILIIVVSLPLGIFLSENRSKIFEKAGIIVNQIVMSIPPFFTGILLTLFFGLVLHWFTPGKFVSPQIDFWSCAGYLVYPAIAISLPRIAMTVKMLRSSIKTELEKDYVRTSYSRGNSQNATLYRHILKNAIAPIITFLAMTIADIVAASIVVEQVFTIPGLGKLLLTSIENRDFPVVQAIVVILALWVVLINGIADLVNQRIDPRLRLG